MSKSKNMRPDGNIGPYLEKSNIYIFGDTSNKTSCFIVSHGGHKFLISSNKQFKVPTGTTVQFFLDHNEALVFPIGGFGRMKLPKMKQSRENKTFTQNQICKNYILTKFQEDDTDDISAQTYKKVQETAKDQDLLFVTIRHRRFHAARTLENTIGDVQRVLPNIKTFYCIHCRVEPGFRHYYNAEFDTIATRRPNGQMGDLERY